MNRFIAILLMSLVILSGCSSESTDWDDCSDPDILINPISEVPVDDEHGLSKDEPQSLTESSQITPNAPNTSSSVNSDFTTQSSGPSAPTQQQSSSQITSSKPKTADAVIMTTAQKSYPLGTDAINIGINNQTKDNFGFIIDYTIEKKAGSSWEAVPVRYNVVEEPQSVPAGSIGNFEFRLYPSQYVYEPGAYRFVLSDTDKNTIYAYFSLTVQEQSPGSVTMTTGGSYPVTSNNIEVEIVNTSAEQLTYVLEYLIKYYNGTTWETLNLSYNVQEIVHEVVQGYPKKHTLSLCQDQHVYLPGKYLVEIKSYQGTTISATFELI